jgi:hypothetical protein
MLPQIEDPFGGKIYSNYVMHSGGIAACQVGNGTTVMFWSDVWNDLLQNRFPRLYSFAKNKQISVAQFLLNNSIQEQFHLPLSVQAFSGVSRSATTHSRNTDTVRN